MDPSVFLLSSPTGLGDFLSIDLVSSSLYPSGLGAWYSGIWFFLLHLPIYRQEVFSTVPRLGYTILIATRSLELAPKKEGNSNAVATKIMWLHLSTGIPLSPSTLFTYYLILIDLFLDTPNLIYLLSGIGFPTSHCWEAHQPLSPAVILQSFYLLRIPPAVILLCWDSVLLFRLFCLLIYLMSVYYHNIVWVKSETSSDVAWAYPALGWMMRYSVTENSGIVGTDLKPWELDLKTRLGGIPDG